MKPLLWSVVCAGSLLACAGYWATEHITSMENVGVRYARTPVERQDEDLAVSCLVWGQVTPQLNAVSSSDLDGYVGVIARLLSSYGKADFDAFLSLRAPDIVHAEHRQASKLDELNGFANQLGGQADPAPETWLEALRRFWFAYYEEPPVQRWIPENTVLMRGEPLATHAGWKDSFERLRATLAGSLIDHNLVIPAPRSQHPDFIGQERVRAVPIEWFDLVLGFETPQLDRGRLLVQFVQRQDQPGEWFLHRAVTALKTRSSQSSLHRQLIL